ncbi:MerR family transcriptional regulator [Chloroflexia bacterium SDU3-3]|nr:MerR family transcriptional regulator [Chloroflexia bacterium SDU3-3]
MLRIGDFSKFSRVSIKALRLYDELGLLKPVQVDPFTSYRYYEFHQLPRLYRILALKDLGFSLESIRHLLDGEVTADHMRGMLMLRRAEIGQRMREEEERLQRVEGLLRQLEEEPAMSSYDVIIKRVEPMLVASVRGVVPTPPEQHSLWAELLAHLEPWESRIIAPCISLYHDPDGKERDWDIEVCAPVAPGLVAQGPMAVGILPGVESMASVIHNGPFATIGQAYDAIARWIDQHGYRIIGPCREVNLRIPTIPGDQHDPDTVCEIQFPVELA